MALFNIKVNWVLIPKINKNSNAIKAENLAQVGRIVVHHLSMVFSFKHKKIEMKYNKVLKGFLFLICWVN